MISSLILAAAALLAPQAPVSAGTLVVGTMAEPVSLEPHRATDVLGAEIVANVCETLVRMRPGSLQPEGILATAWATRDQRTWTFTLRKGVFFHDGTPFDADAVVLGGSSSSQGGQAVLSGTAAASVNQATGIF